MAVSPIAPTATVPILFVNHVVIELVAVGVACHEFDAAL
jgi:hypothetical protein